MKKQEKSTKDKTRQRQKALPGMLAYMSIGVIAIPVLVVGYALAWGLVAIVAGSKTDDLLTPSGEFGWYRWLVLVPMHVFAILFCFTCLYYCWWKVYMFTSRWRALRKATDVTERFFEKAEAFRDAIQIFRRPDKAEKRE